MNKKVFGTIAVVAAMFVGYKTYITQNNDGITGVVLANIEALASSSESGKSYGCGKAAFEADDDWYEDTKTFKWCSEGCPDSEGTSPKYIDC